MSGDFVKSQSANIRILYEIFTHGGSQRPPRVHHVGLSVTALSNFNLPAASQNPPSLPTLTVLHSAAVYFIQITVMQQFREEGGRASNGFFEGASEPAKGQQQQQQQ